MLSQEKMWLLKEKYGGVESEAFHADCARLHAGEPLAYVIGHIPFLTCTIYLDSRPLIPRPETEYWTQKFLQQLAARDRIHDLRVLDLCAGSGCIGVAIAKAVPSAHVDFVELDPAHILTIKKNLHKNLAVNASRSTPGVEREARYRIIQADLFTPESSTPGVELGRYDYIVSNPPYIDPELDRTEVSVRAHEPAQALYGGTEGLELIARIIAAAPQYLKPEGQLWLEHEPEQTAAITDLAEKHKFRSTTHQDQYGIERYTQLMLQ